MITQEEAEALRFEFQALVKQKNDPAVTWTAGKEKHLQGVLAMMNAYDKQNGDFLFFLRSTATAAKETKPLAAQLQLI